MLGFDERPDRVFSAIVQGALAVAADLIDHHVEGRGDDPQEWTDHVLDLAPWFSPHSAQETLKRLIAAHRDPHHIYRLTDYHRLLIYKCLSLACDIHNDELKVPPGDAPPFGPYRIGLIDLDVILDIFFPDIDFLHGQEILHLAGEDRQRRTISDESFDIAAGHQAHPDELVLSTCADEDGWLTREDDEYPAAGWIPMYPREAENPDE